MFAISRRKFLKYLSAGVLVLSGGAISWIKFGVHSSGESPAETPGNTSSIYPIPPIKPPSERPRVLLRKSDIPSIKAKMNHPETVNVWKTILRNSESNTAGAKIGTIIGVYEANALLYVLQNDEQAGIKAKNLVMENIAYYDSIDDADSIEVGVFIGSLGIVYDWCHKFFSNDELQIVISTIKRIASKMESGYPPVKQSSITGHSSEYLIMRDLMMAGIAAYDEDPEIYNLAAGRFFDEHLPARNFFIRRERTIRVFLMGTTDTAAIYFLRLFSTEWDAAMFLIRHRVKFRTSGYICTGRTG